MGRHQRSVQVGIGLLILVDQPVAQLAQGHPFIGAADQPQTLGAIEVLQHGGRRLLHGAQVGWQKFIAQQILQPTKSGHECVHALRKVDVLATLTQLCRRPSLGKKPGIGLLQMVELPSRQVLQLQQTQAL